MPTLHSQIDMEPQEQPLKDMCPVKRRGIQGVPCQAGSGRARKVGAINVFFILGILFADSLVVLTFPIEYLYLKE